MKRFLALLALVLVAGLVVWTLLRSQESAAPTQPIPTPNVAYVPNQVAPPIPLALASKPAVEPAPLESAPRESIEAPTIHGRVVEKITRAAVARVPVTLSSAERMLAGMSTNAAGEFQFEIPGGDIFWVSILAPRGSTTPHPRVQFDRASVAREIVFELETARTLRGFIVDAETRDIVPACTVRLVDPTNRSDIVKSDALGAFVTTVGLEPGPLVMRWIPVDPSIEISGGTSITVPANTNEIEIPVHVGPTYQLAIRADKRVEVGALRATLLQKSPGGLLDENTSDDATPLTEGPPPWVRFPPPNANALAPDPWTLWVFSEDGRLRGSALVDSVPRRVPSSVDVHLESVATVELRVVDEKGAPVPEARLLLGTMTDDGKFDDAVWLRERTPGLFAARGVTPGTYHLIATCKRRESVQCDIEIALDGPPSIEIVMRERASAGDVAGRVHSVTGRFSTRTIVDLVEIGGQRRWTHAVFWKDDGHGLEGSFRFEAVPPGRYRIELRSQEPFAWRPPEVEVIAPNEEIEFLCLDDTRSAALAVEAFDAEDGTRVNAFEIAWNYGSQFPWFEQTSTGRCELGRVPAGIDVEWRVAAPGFASAVGNLTSFGVSSGVDGARLARVSLRRGWGTRFLALGPAGEPLAGVRVLLDGNEVGTTDDGGRLDVLLPLAPKRIEVVYRDWRMGAADDSLPDEEPNGFTPIRMAPPK